MGRKETILDEVDMFDVLAEFGFTMLERSRQRYNTFVKGDTKIIVHNEHSKPQFYFNSNQDPNDKGDIIALVKYHKDQNETNYPDVLKYLSGFTSLSTTPRPNVQSHTPREIIQEANVLQEFDVNKFTLRDHIDSRLMDKKGLHGVSAAEAFKGTVLMARHLSAHGEKNLFGGFENLAFLLKRLDTGEIKGMEYRFDGEKSMKRQAPGSMKAETFWIANKPEGSEDIFLCESPIDAMSHYAMYVNKTGQHPAVQYLSTSGTVTDEQIRQIMASSKGRIFMGFDNDFAGYGYTIKLLSAFSNGKLTFETRRNEIEVDGTFLNLDCNIILSKGAVSLPGQYGKLMSAVSACGLFPRLFDAKAKNKDFNDDLTSGVPCVYEFDKTIGSIENLRYFVGEEAHVVKKKDFTDTTDSLIKNNLKMENETKFSKEDVSGILARYGTKISDLNKIQVDGLMHGYGVLVNGLKSLRPDSKKPQFDARIRLSASGKEGNRIVDSKLDFKADKLVVYSQMFGHKIDEKMEKELKETGFLTLYNCVREKTGEQLGTVVVAVDPELNKLQYGTMAKVNIPKKLKGVDLNDEQRLELKNGKEINLHLFDKEVGVRFNPVVSSFSFMDAERKEKYREDLKKVPTASKEEVAEIEAKILANRQDAGQEKSTLLQEGQKKNQAAGQSENQADQKHDKKPKAGQGH